MRSKNYTIVYTPEHGGFTYVIRCGGKFVAQAWVHGHKRTAEQDARETIAALQRKAA